MWCSDCGICTCTHDLHMYKSLRSFMCMYMCINYRVHLQVLVSLSIVCIHVLESTFVAGAHVIT